MSPMDEYRWFEAPTVTNLTLTQNVATQLVKRNVRRVALFFGLPVSSPAPVNISIGNNVSATHGMEITAGTVPFIFIVKDHGNAPQEEWWGFTNGLSVILHITEIILIDWPQLMEAQNARG